MNKNISQINFEDILWLRGRERYLTHDASELEDPYAMTFVVNDDKSRTHTDEDVILSVSHAMLLLLANTDSVNIEHMNAWLQGRIRKLVKRGRGSAFEKAKNVIPIFSEIHEPEHVLALTPMRVSEVPVEVRKLQLTGLTTEHTSTTQQDRSNMLHVEVNHNLQMSASKIAVQVAHVVQLFVMFGDEKDVKSFLNNACKIQVSYKDLKPDPDLIQIFDAGFTEIPSGSLTAQAIFYEK